MKHTFRVLNVPVYIFQTPVGKEFDHYLLHGREIEQLFLKMGKHWKLAYKSKVEDLRGLPIPTVLEELQHTLEDLLQKGHKLKAVVIQNYGLSVYTAQNAL